MITAEELEKLAEFKEKGIISEEEFNSLKEEYLKSSDTHALNIDFSKLNFNKLKTIGLCSLLVFGLLALYNTLHNTSEYATEYTTGYNIYCAQYRYGEYPERYDWSGGMMRISQKDIDSGSSTGKCLGHLDTNGKIVDINFPSAEVMKDWAQYDRQFIRIKGEIKKDWHGNYYIYNPRFVEYAN